jgi:hypothetical protein
MEPAKVDVAAIERKIMSETVIEKTWQIAAHGGKGPVTITLRMPEVTVTGSEGRYIVIAPQQAGLVICRMGNMPTGLTMARTSDRCSKLAAL